MEKTREKYPIDVELFKELFILREDVYALQTVTGSYMKVEKPLTMQLLKDHLLGKVTIGNSSTDVKLVSCVLYCG